MASPDMVTKKTFFHVIKSTVVWMPIILGGAIIGFATGGASWIGWAGVAAGLGAAAWKLTVGRRQIES